MARAKATKGTFINVKVDADLKKTLMKIKSDKVKAGEKTTLNEIVGKALTSYANRATA